MSEVVIVERKSYFEDGFAKTTQSKVVLFGLLNLIKQTGFLIAD